MATKTKFIELIQSALLPEKVREKFLKAASKCPEELLPFLEGRLTAYQTKQKELLVTAFKKDPKGHLFELSKVEQKNSTSNEEVERQGEEKQADELLTKI